MSIEGMIDAIEGKTMPETAAEALARWDAGKIVWSVSMGGLGPGYEQCIQVAAFELIRQALDVADWPVDTDESWAAFSKALRDAPHPWEEALGLSGAQFGAAMNIACVTLRRGWKAGIQMAPQERHIQVSRDWPQPPARPS